MPYEAGEPEDKTEFDEDEKGRLLAALKAEESQAVGYQTTAEVTQFNDSLDRYFGKPYGDEIAGRSSITTREVYETISWTLPDLLDIFAAGGRICDLEADSQEAEAQIEDRADYLDYVFFKDNPGVLILHDFIFDALAHPRAYVDVDWNAEPAYGGWEQYDNLTQLQIMDFVQDEGTEVNPKSLREIMVAPDEAYPDGKAYSVKVRKKLRDGCVTLEVVPPEDMFVAGRQPDLAQARYKGRIIRWRRSVWKSYFPECRQEIDEYSGNDESGAADNDGRRQSRFDDGQASDGEWATAANKAAQELVGRKEYIYYADPEDEDGEAVLLRVYRLGDLILEVEEVDDDPFASAVSDRVPHRLQGLSIAEVLGDLQKLKTVLTRSLVDGVMQSSVPRIAANKEKVNLNDLLNLSHGAVIRVDGEPAGNIFPIQTPDLSAGVLKALEWTDQIAEQRTGITRHAQGMDPDSLNHTAKGIQLIQNAANARKRLIARLIAVGVEEMMTKVDRVIQRHQKAPRNVKLGKTWKTVDPRSWSPGMKVTVTVGLGTGAKDVQLAFLQMIQQDQVAWVANYGLQTPVVTPKHLYSTVTEKLRIMGYQSPDKFFGEPVTKDPQTGESKEFVPEPAPDPNQKKIEADTQLKQAQMQMDAQNAQAKQMLDMQIAKQQASLEIEKAKANLQQEAQSSAAKLEHDKEKAAVEIQLARDKAQAELDLANQTAANEFQLAVMKMQQERELAEMQMAIDTELEKERIASSERVGHANAEVKVRVGKANGSSKPTLSKNREGGSLSE